MPSSRPEPLPGWPEGDRQPLDRLPDDLVCPCGDGPFETESGLRGHAHGKHGILWEKREDAKPAPFAGHLVKPTEREELLPWHKVCIADHVLNGMSWPKVAEKHRSGSGADTLRKVYKSPAGRRYREELNELVRDPKRVAEMLLRSTSAGVFIEYLAAFESAKDTGDYAEVGRMARDLLDRTGVGEGKRSAEGGTITINLNAKSLDSEADAVEASYEIVSEEEEDVDHFLETAKLEAPSD